MNPTSNGMAPRPIALPPPLRTASDMAGRWEDLEEDFDAAAERILRAHAKDGSAVDLPITDLRTWGVVPVEGRFALAPLGKHHSPKVVRSAAFAGLMGRLGAPTEFIRDRLPMPLQIATCNYLLSVSDQAVPTTLRLRDDQVSALVSDRYAPLDPPELIASIREALVRQGALHEVRVRSVATGLVDVLRLVFPSSAAAVNVGDVSAVGIDISSSSFGRSAVHVQGILWRLRCTNGLRVPEKQGGFSFRHVGDVQRLRAGIAEAIPTALLAARGTMDRWKAAVNVMVEDVAAEIERLRELTVIERTAMTSALLTESGAKELPERTTAYDFVNALTEAAHEAVPARRLELESIAGDLLVRHTT